MCDLDEKETLRNFFDANDVRQARRVLDETEIPLYRDELLLLVHDILPYVYTSPASSPRLMMPCRGLMLDTDGSAQVVCEA